MNELDVVREVNADVPRASTLTTARERMMAAIAEEKAPALRRKHRKVRVATWTTTGIAAAAAAVVVLVGTTPTPASPTPTNAAFVLNESADRAIHQQDQPIAPGQYRYVAEHISVVGSSSEGRTVYFAWRERDTKTTWVPYDQSGVWTRDQYADGKPEILVGKEHAAQFKDVLTPGYHQGRTTARCGDFERSGEPRCDRGFDEKDLTSAMFASVPRDPHRLLTDEYLGTDLPTVVSNSITWLGSGLVPADLRAAVYRALALVPGIRITDDVADLDGRKGVAFGGNAPGDHEDVIIDPATGQYLGFRSLDDGTMGMPKGTVRASTSMVTGVVDEVGEVPGH